MDVSSTPGAAAPLLVRPLVAEDARTIAELTGAVTAEIGVEPTLLFEETVELVRSDWLRRGTGLVLAAGEQVLGYGWVRDAEWNGRRVVEFGLFLSPGAREPERHSALTTSLLEAASGVSARYGGRVALCHIRSLDYVHPPVLRAIGFRDLPTTMVGFRHDLRALPEVATPPDLVTRPARLPAERELITRLQTAVFNDPLRQGESMEPDYLELITERPGFAEWQVLIAELKGKPVGYAAMINDPESQDGASLLEIGVIPACRRQSIGSALVRHLLERSLSAGIGQVLTGCFSTNPGIGLYWRLGFRPDALRTYYFFYRPLESA